MFSFGRVQSQRCPNKLLRPFGDTTLTDIILEKLSAFGDQAFFAAHEQEFRAPCDRHQVRFVPRTLHSASIDEPITEILSFLREQPYTHFLIVNACLPFLKTSTIRTFLDECTRTHEPAFGVIRRKNHFISLNHTPLNFPDDLQTINSKTVEPVLEFAHALYFFEREYFFEHGRYWNWKTVRLVELPDGRELVDIDTEHDFEFAEALWRGSGGAFA